MSFWTGFTTGLASSVDRGLQNAIKKRDEELSEAKRFWMARQADKAEKKEEYDARAVKALERVIGEAGNDTALGLAIYNSVGDLDQVEDLLSDIAATKKAGEQVNLLNMVTLPQGFADQQTQDVTMEQARASVKKQMKGITREDISVNTGGLFGTSDAAIDKIVNQVNKRYEPDEPTAIEAGVFEGVTIDRSGLLPAKEYQLKQQQAEQSLRTSLDDDFDDISKKLIDIDITTPEGQAEAAELGARQEAIAQALIKKRDATEKAGGSITIPTMNTLYEGGRTSYLAKSGIIEGANAAYRDPDTGIYVPEATNPGLYNDLKVKAENEYNDMFIDTHSGTTSGDNFIQAETYGIKARMKEREAASGAAATDAPDAAAAAAAASDAAAAAAKKAQDAGFSSAADVVNNPAGYIDFIRQNNSAVTNDELRGALNRAGVPDNQIDAILAPAAASTPSPQPDPSSATADPPMPLTKLTPGSNAYNEWLATYGDTHNPDGTRK